MLTIEVDPKQHYNQIASTMHERSDPGIKAENDTPGVPPNLSTLERDKPKNLNQHIRYHELMVLDNILKAEKQLNLTKKRARELTSTHVDCLFSGLVVASDPPSTECVEVLQRPIVTVPMYRYAVDDFVRL